ncbi:MAG: hypothetical protein HRU28_09930 [Rhizobiales bacterium]|nr:hypothetical protein [Hyphomicrobiales bacterium]
MEISPMTAMHAMSAQGQTQQIMNASMVKAAHASEMAMVEMIEQATEMVKANQAPAPAGMGAKVDKLA